jgi:hypothetical protein
MDQGFLYFPRPEWDGTFSRFSSDFRPELGSGQVWTFEVTGSRKSMETIRVIGIDQVPAGASVVLVNMLNSTPVDLRRRQEYSFDAVSTVIPFKLIVGSADFVAQEIQSLQPEAFDLGQNYPNPFNSSTSISVTLPKDSKVRLDVFSILGERIKTITDERYSPGVHTFRWDGTNTAGKPVASGVYFYRFTDGGNFVLSKKMIFAK